MSSGFTLTVRPRSLTGVAAILMMKSLKEPMMIFPRPTPGSFRSPFTGMSIDTSPCLSFRRTRASPMGRSVTPFDWSPSSIPSMIISFLLSSIPP